MGGGKARARAPNGRSPAPVRAEECPAVRIVPPLPVPAPGLPAPANPRRQIGNGAFRLAGLLPISGESAVLRKAPARSPSDRTCSSAPRPSLPSLRTTCPREQRGPCPPRETELRGALRGGSRSPGPERARRGSAGAGAGSVGVRGFSSGFGASCFGLAPRKFHAAT